MPFKRYPLLRQRALYQGLMFASFSLFWTAAPLLLSSVYGLSQTQIVGLLVLLLRLLQDEWRMRAHRKNVKVCHGVSRD